MILFTARHKFHHFCHRSSKEQWYTTFFRDKTYALPHKICSQITVFLHFLAFSSKFHKMSLMYMARQGA